MTLYNSKTLKISNLDQACAHFSNYDNFMSILPGDNGKYDYETKFFVMGSSFVSFSLSYSGWGYRPFNEVDGFLMTIPHSGGFQWQTSNGTYRIGRGVLEVVDLKNVNEASYGTHTKYTSVYIANTDVFRQLSLILGQPPKNRVHFDVTKSGLSQVHFIQKISETIIDLGTESKFPVKGVADSLKESLIGFLLYNFHNNYTQTLNTSNTALTPTPHVINKAAEYMASSVDPHLTVCEIAAHAGLSVRSLQAGFRTFKKTTPIAFLREQRLHRAKCLLNDADSQSTPKEIAKSCGFINYQLFCKYYTKQFNEFPDTLSKRLKEPKDKNHEPSKK